MDWDQIESKWAEMTLRVRGEASTVNADATGRTPRRLATVDALAVDREDRPSNFAADEKTTMSAQ